MASVADKEDTKLNSWGPKWERMEHKKLRYSGQEYVSKSGKVIPAKKQPELVCTCPQKCGEKIPPLARERLFKEFYRLSDHAMQNRFLQAHIEIRAVQRRFWRQQQRTASGRIQRRVSCKYQVPLITGPDDVSDQGEVRPGVKIVEVCQKAFMNVYAITEKRVRIQRERLICHAQEMASSPSPVSRESSPLGLPRTPDSPFPFGVPRDLMFGATAPLSTLNNLSITPSRLGNEAIFSKMTNGSDILAALGDRDVTMVPAHNSSLSIIPVKAVDAHQNSIPAAFPMSTAKIPRDVTMIPVNDTDTNDMPTDLSMPKPGSVKVDPPTLKMPPVTTLEPVSNQPVDLTIKSSKPMNELKKDNKVVSAKPDYESGLELTIKNRPPVIFPKADVERKEKRFEDDRPLPPVSLPFDPNAYDLALVNSFFQNQLWQPEYIDIDHLREYQRKLEESAKERDRPRERERKRKPRKSIRILPTEIVDTEKVALMDLAKEVPDLVNKLENAEAENKVSPNFVPKNCDERKSLISVSEARE